MVVLGSGGHTAEMLALASKLDKTVYQPRCYVVGHTDSLGSVKAAAAEKPVTPQVQDTTNLNWSVRNLPRSREVGQSYLTSVWTTMKASYAAVGVVWQEAPGLVLVNGPGTCIPICLAAFLLRLLGRDSKVVYVESIARVAKLSLSGWILYNSCLVDAIFVQWPELAAKYPGSIYAGRVF